MENIDKDLNTKGIDHNFLNTLNQHSEFISENDLESVVDVDKNKINIKDDCLLTIMDGNVKLDHPYIGLPAGHTCPFAKICKTKVPQDREKIHDKLIQKYGDLYCYAAGEEVRYPNAQTMRWRNKDLLDAQGDKTKMVELILKSLKFFEMKKKKHIDVFRVHESGDFYNLNYFDAWMDVAKIRPDILFYAYTKSLPFWIKRKYDIPSNFKLIASYGGKFDDMISKHDLQYAVVVKSKDEADNLGLKVDVDDTLAYNSDENFALLLHGMQPAGELSKQSRANREVIKQLKQMKNITNEAEHNGKNVELNKPTKGDVKKYKVFVKDPSTGNVKKVNFGDPNMEIKRDDPERRKSFRARHKCDTAKDKTTPRYWSCKFWSKKSVSDLLKEVIEPDAVDVSSIEMNDELCPLIWDGDKLKPDVRKTLLLNAKRFIEFCDMENMKFEDIMLTGSMANYNYNENSDIDVHIIMDFSQISENKEFVGDFFKMKKQLWSEKLPIQVKGHDVEMYFQDIIDPHHSTGTYSIIDDEWIAKPIKKLVNVNSGAVQLKAADLMNAIDDLNNNRSKNDFLKKHTLLKNKIKKHRQSGLETGGEYSVENLAFKILRNSGYLQKLMDMKNDYLTQELSLDEFLNPDM